MTTKEILEAFDEMGYQVKIIERPKRGVWDVIVADRWDRPLVHEEGHNTRAEAIRAAWRYLP